MGITLIFQKPDEEFNGEFGCKRLVKYYNWKDPFVGFMMGRETFSKKELIEAIQLLDASKETYDEEFQDWCDEFRDFTLNQIQMNSSAYFSK